MAEIKTREKSKGIKALDKAVVAGERMKRAFVRSKDQAENLLDDGQISPSEYAEDKVRYMAEDTAREVGHEAGKLTGKAKSAYLKSTTGFAVTQFLFLHRFYDQLLEFRRVSFVWYSLWHRKNTPFLSTSIIPYLSNKWGAVQYFCIPSLSQGTSLQLTGFAGSSVNSRMFPPTTVSLSSSANSFSCRSHRSKTEISSESIFAINSFLQ